MSILPEESFGFKALVVEPFLVAFGAPTHRTCPFDDNATDVPNPSPIVPNSANNKVQE